MKKIALIFATILLSIFFTACSKVAFEKQAPLENAALVYVYVVPEEGINMTTRVSYYKVGINGKKAEGGLKVGEYKAYNLKPGMVSISAFRGDLEEQKIDMELASGKTYYLKVKSFSDDFAKFEIKRVNANVAYEELSNTTLAGEYVKESNIISEFITPKEEASVAVAPQPVYTKSKTEELQNAAALKAQGILTEAEFNKLKAEILSK
ncbi:MAG: SHOCT domain-containing protein [Sulfurimonas sp.]|nr:SHOCT domain-containing protein [Sulfurimonas sp.]